jgi:polyferredoxin
MRRVFFFAFSVGVVIALVVQFWPTKFLMMALLLCATICAVATFIDSIQGKSAFVEQLKDLEAEQILRVYEHGGDEAVAMMEGVFSREEKRFTRRKKREYNAIILVKLLFAIIFVVIFVSLL